MKRFYKQVDVIECEGGHTVALDSRSIRTPLRHLLVLPHRALAEAVANEWQSQGDDIHLNTMYITRFCYAAIDFDADLRARAIERLLEYANTDLVFYRSEFPQKLRDQQDSLWQPCVDVVQSHADVTLKIAYHVQYLSQDERYQVFVEEFLQRLDVFSFCAFKEMVFMTTSFVICANVVYGNLEPRKAFDIATLDEHFQFEQWGDDEEARVALNNIASEFMAAAAVLQNCAKEALV